MSQNNLPVFRPTLPPFDKVCDLLQPSYDSGIVTLGEQVKALEEDSCRATGASHVIAVANATSGLMLSYRALGLKPGGEVICPSMTFAATAHAVVWNGLIPVFVDCLPGTLTMDPAEVRKALSEQTAAICPVYVYGLPPDLEELWDMARDRGVPLVTDAAQGLGSFYHGRPAGAFGTMEVFSLSPTKVITALEGGLISTGDEELALRLRSLRDYGKAWTGSCAKEDMQDIGLSARMSEAHAAVGRLSLQNREALVGARLEWIRRYRERLAGLKGCSSQVFPTDRQSSGNYFVLFISSKARNTRDEVHEALAQEGIQTKRYFFPPVHEQTGQNKYPMRVVGNLPVTQKASQEALVLPLYSHMKEDQFERVCRAVEKQLRG